MGRPPSTTRPVGLFCGLAVVDVIQLVQEIGRAHV